MNLESTYFCSGLYLLYPGIYMFTFKVLTMFLGQSFCILQLCPLCSLRAVLGGYIIKEQEMFFPWLHKVKNVSYFNTSESQLLQALKIT